MKEGIGERENGRMVDREICFLPLSLLRVLTNHHPYNNLINLNLPDIIVREAFSQIYSCCESL